MILTESQPTTLEEAVNEILESLTEKDKQEILKISPNHIHLTLGMYLRNHWNLWKRDSEINKFFVETYGLCHADDISAIILENVWARVSGQPDKTLDLVKEFKEHWLNYGLDAATMEPILGHDFHKLKPKTFKIGSVAIDGKAVANIKF